MSRNVKILVLAVLALVNIAFFVYLAQRQSRASLPPVTNHKDIKQLPAVEFVDDNGKRDWFNRLTGRVVLVQFVNPKIATQLQSVSKLITGFEENQVWLVLITKDAQELRSRLPRVPGNTLVVQRNNAELRNTFNVPSCCERRFIFDNNGVLQYKDYYYETDLGPRVRSLVKHGEQDIRAAMVQALESVTAGRFASLRDQVRNSQSGKSVVILLDSVNTSCPSGEIIKSANRFATAHKDIPLIVILPSYYSPIEVENFKTNLQVGFSVEKADAALTEKWSPILTEFGEGQVNGSVFLIERGNLLSMDDLAAVERQFLH